MRRVVLEVTRLLVRAVLVEGPPNRLRVQQIVVEPLNDAPTAELLQRLLKPLQPSRAEVISVVAREQILTRTLKLPATQHDELDPMINLAAKAQLPYPPEHAAIDWALVDQQEGMSLVQLVACQRELIDRHLTLLRESGLEPAMLTPTSWGVAGWYRRFGKSPGIQEPTMALHVERERTDLVVIRDHRVVFSRSLNQGLEEWRTSLDPLLQELERSLTNVRKELPGMEAVSVVLTGIGALEEWRGMIEQRLGLPVTVRQGYEEKTWPEPVRRHLSREAPHSLVIVMGLAFADTTDLVNLLPHDVRETQQHRRRSRELALTGGLFAVVLLCGAGVLVNVVHRQTSQNQQTLGVMKQLEAMTQQTDRQLNDLRLIEGVLVSRRTLAAALTSLVSVTPSEVLFENLTFEQSRHELLVRGSAPTTRDVLEYLRVLKQDDRWQRVELRYSARRGSGADSRTDFEIMLEPG